MATGAWMSALGLYNFDPTIFDEMKLPTELDRATLIANVLLETSELEICYPDPAFFKQALGLWSAMRLPVWEKLEATLHLEYNPIHNYDRTEEWDEAGTRDLAENQNNQRDGSETSKADTEFTGKTTAQGEDTEHSTNEKQVSAYNETTYAPAEKQIMDSEKLSQQTNNSESNTGSTGEIDRSESELLDRKANEQTTNKRSGRAYGNIGVTTTQQMIEAEREVVRFNLTETIIAEFKQRFCIMVY